MALQMVPPSDTRKNILDTAETLLLDKGFNGFSYAHIAERLAVKNAAIHYHFPSKADLGCALIARYRRRFQRWCEAVSDSTHSATDRLNGYFGIALGYARQGGKVCPLGMLETEFNTIAESVRDQIRALDEQMRCWLSEVLAQGRASGEFQFVGTPEHKALIITAALQGVLQIARPAGRSVVINALRQLRMDLQMQVQS